MRTAILILSVLYSVAASAQTATESNGRVFIFSSVGLSVLKKGVNPSFGSSIQTATGLGYKLSGHSSLAGTLSFDNYGYQKSGTAYNLDGKMRVTALALFYKYTFGSNAWRPYLKAGGGGARLSVPTVVVSPGITNIKNEAETPGLLLGEAGLEVRVHTRYSLFAGAEGKWMGKSDLLGGTSLQPMTVKVGLISSF